MCVYIHCSQCRSNVCNICYVNSIIGRKWGANFSCERSWVRCSTALEIVYEDGIVEPKVVPYLHTTNGTDLNTASYVIVRI